MWGTVSQNPVGKDCSVWDCQLNPVGKDCSLRDCQSKPGGEGRSVRDCQSNPDGERSQCVGLSVNTRWGKVSTKTRYEDSLAIDWYSPLALLTVNTWELTSTMP